jgi:aldehyde dehydrogenase (NAD+)
VLQSSATALGGVTPSMTVAKEESFGPVLPVLTYSDISEPIAHINAGDKPLALYVFSRDDAVVERILGETSSGGACVNETVMQFANSELPFGGVGESGMGAYHARAGFETFSHRKSVYRRPTWFRDPGLLRPPYTRLKAKTLKKLF